MANYIGVKTWIINRVGAKACMTNFSDPDLWKTNLHMDLEAWMMDDVNAQTWMT